MKTEWLNRRFQSNQPKVKKINWDQLVCFVLLAIVWSACDVLSPDELETNVGIYMWSNTFESVDNESLVYFLEDKDVTSVFLSVGFHIPELEKAKQFVQIANEKEIEVDLLFGGNEIVNQETDDQLSQMNRLSEIARQIGVDEIHLDVEPHTFDDWDRNRSNYEKSYLTMLKNAEKIFTEASLSISVSIPHFYDPINSEIEEYVDDAVVMVYETTDIKTIKSRTEEESSVFEEKLSIAIRPEDYSNAKTLDGVIIQIMETKTANRVFLHDVGALMNIEN